MKKLLSIILGAAVTAAMCVTAFAFDLGAPTITSDNQAGWLTNGVDGVESSLEMEDLVNATQLIVELANEPADTFQFVIFGGGNNWSWAQTEDAASVSGTTLTFNVTEMTGWADTMTGENAKMILGYWGEGGWSALGIQSARLVVPGGTPGGAAEAVTAVPIAEELPPASTTVTGKDSGQPSPPTSGSNMVVLFVGLFAAALLGCIAVRKVKVQ
jgi:hypothetical protein